jgi:hypothetical protein
MGGKLELVAQFPNRPPMVIEHLGGSTAGRHQADSARSLARKAA